MMSTPKLPHSTSADRSTKVMGLGLRDVNESLAGSLGITEGTTEYMNLTSCVSETVESFIGDGSAISSRQTSLVDQPSYLLSRERIRSASCSATCTGTPVQIVIFEYKHIEIQLRWLLVSIQWNTVVKRDH